MCLRGVGGDEFFGTGGSGALGESLGDNGECEEIMFLGKSHPNPGSVQCVLLLNDVVWCGCGDGTLMWWGVENKKILNAKRDHTEAIYSIIAVANQVWSASKDKTILVWEKDLSKPSKVIKTGEGFVSCLTRVAKHVWGGTSTGVIKQWSTKGKCKKELTHKGVEAIGCMTVRGSQVWVGTDHLILVVDIDSFTVRFELDSHKHIIHNISKVGDNMWSCSSDKTIKVWSINGDLLKTILGHSGRVFSLLPVGSHVWSGSWDSSVFVWDKQTQSFLYELKGHHTDGVSSLLTIEKGGKVVEVWSGSWDKTLCYYTYINPPLVDHPIPSTLLQ